MRDKEPQFTVTDRRKFTSDGELREGHTAVTETITPPVVAPQQVTSPASAVAAAEPEGVGDEETIPEPTAEQRLSRLRPPPG